MAHFTEKEKIATKNAVMLVGLLYTMCQVKLVIKQESEDALNLVNNEEINKAIHDADIVLQEIQ